MTIASVIIAAAFRENNIVGVGLSPTANEAAEGLTVLNNVLSQLFGNEIGEHLYDWPIIPPQRTAPVAANYPQGPGACDLTSSQWPYPPANSRLVCTNTGAVTVYFPERPSDGARMAYLPIGTPGTVTLDGNSRYINGAATAAPGATATTWLYRADTGNWVPIAALASGDAMPLPATFDDYFICATNIRLCPRFGKTVKPETIAVLKDQRSKLITKYRQDVKWVGGGADVPSTFHDNGWSEPLNFNPGA